MENKKRSRRDRILELINEKGSLTTAELSNYFQVTNETIRKHTVGQIVLDLCLQISLLRH